jgi:asparagine synthase (glutamine-hydrolysing)
LLLECGKEEYLKDVNLLSTSDTEVLLHLLIKYGMSFLNKLNGMFAFAFYDISTGNTYLVRDRYGVKPLYYWKNDKSFAFSSEDKALVENLNIPYVFNSDFKKLLIEDAISDNDELTTIENIYQVPAGHYICISDTNSINKYKWYNFSDTATFNYSNKDDILSYFEYIFTDSLKIRNRSDVKVGITLSGGLDSSLIYTIAKEKLNAKYEIFTYSNENKELDEYDKVSKLASEYGDSVIKITQKEDTMEIFKKSLIHLNAPIWAPSHTGYFNTYSAIHENNIKVILEGHGADELLGGWPWTLTSAIVEAFKTGHPALSYEIFLAQQKTWNPNLEQRFNLKFKDYLKILIKKSRADKHCFADLLDDLFSRRILPINLRCWDRLSMANSIESRCPFLDYRVVEFLKKLPLQYKVNKLGNKAILRELLLKYNKDYIVENKVKQGYLSSEIDFLNKNSDDLLKYYDTTSNSIDITAWKNKTLDYSYDTKTYRIIAFNLLNSIYN